MQNQQLTLAGLLFILLAITSLLIGAADVSLSALFSGEQHAYDIYVVSRIPRLLAIVLAGAGLSISGLVMQQIMQNRFASPSTTGTIDCALLGYVVGLIVLQQASQWTYLSLIFTFAVLGTLLFVRFLQQIQFKNIILVPLIGIMYGNVVSALTTFLAYKYDLVQTMSAWSIANFASVLQGNYEILFLACQLVF